MTIQHDPIATLKGLFIQTSDPELQQDIKTEISKFLWTQRKDRMLGNEPEEVPDELTEAMEWMKVARDELGFPSPGYMQGYLTAIKPDHSSPMPQNKSASTDPALPKVSPYFKRLQQFMNANGILASALLRVLEAHHVTDPEQLSTALYTQREAEEFNIHDISAAMQTAVDADIICRRHGSTTLDELSDLITKLKAQPQAKRHLNNPESQYGPDQEALLHALAEHGPEPEELMELLQRWDYDIETIDQYTDLIVELDIEDPQHLREKLSATPKLLGPISEQEIRLINCVRARRVHPRAVRTLITRNLEELIIQTDEIMQQSQATPPETQQDTRPHPTPTEHWPSLKEVIQYLKPDDTKHKVSTPSIAALVNRELKDHTDHHDMPPTMSHPKYSSSRVYNPSFIPEIYRIIQTRYPKAHLPPLPKDYMTHFNP